MQDLFEALQELRLIEAKEDIEKFKTKFGEKTYNDFVKAKDRLKNKKISTDLTYHVRNTSPEEMNDIIQSLYDKESDKQRLRQIQGKDKEIRGKYKDFGVHGGYQIFQPLDYVASMDLGVNTCWCTTGRYNPEGYHRRPPEYTPSEKDAKQHFDQYTKKLGIKLYYLLDPDTMYAKWAFAIYPKNRIVDKDIGDRHVWKTNFELINADNEVIYDTKIIDIFNEVFPDTLNLSGKKYANNLKIKDGVILKANTNANKIEIPDSVTTIERHAFVGCSLTEIIIPNSVKSIGYEAFGHCKNLELAAMTGSPKIGYGLFAGCTALKDVKLPDSLKTIPYMMFSNCTSLESIKLPSKVKEIQGDSFWDCKALRSINIPASVKSINDYAFDGCEALESIYVEKGSYAEKWCKKNGFSDKVKYSR